MTKNRYVYLSILALILFSALAIALSMPARQANAWRSEPTSTAVLDDGNGSFVKSELSKLYCQLVSGATSLQQLNTAANKVASEEYRATGTGAGDFAQLGFTVMLGNKKWTPVHLTTDCDGNVILTLWLAWTSDAQPWSACQLDGFTWQNTPQTQYDPYPMNMYSSSYIRAYLNGTDYLAEASATQLTSGKSVQADEWKIFLSSFDKYLVAPENIAYQANERSSVLLPEFRDNVGNILQDPFDNLNEGYAEDGLNYNVQDGYDYRAKNGYADWKTDKLWLPSLSETGHGTFTSFQTDEHGTYYFPEGKKYDAGLWNTVWDQTTTDSHAHGSWLRSGNTQTETRPSGDAAYALDITGSMGTKNVDSRSNQSQYVRPAIHLNLTAIENGSQHDENVGKPQSQTVVAQYDGCTHTLAIPDYTEMDLGDIPDGAAFGYGILSAVDAGTYTLEAAPKSGKWADGTADPVEFTLTIEPRPLEVHIYGDTEGGFHVFGQTPTVKNLRLGALYGAFVGDDDIEDLGEISPVLTSRADGKVYPFDADMPVGTYDVEIQNGVYNNYDVTFVKSAAFGWVEECVYTVLPSDDVAILVSGYLVQNGSVTVPYDGKQKHVGLLNIDVKSRSVKFYQNGVELSEPPSESGEYVVNVMGTYTATFTLVIEDDKLPPTKPVGDQLTLTRTYNGNKITLAIPSAGKMSFGPVPQGATLDSGGLSAVNVGVYALTASPKEGQWRDGTSDSVTFVLTVLQADIDMTRVEYRVDDSAPAADGFSVAYNGLPKELTVINLPAGVTAAVEYYSNGAKLDGAPTTAGEYAVKVIFAVDDTANFNVPQTKEFVLVISENGSVHPTTPSDPVAPTDPNGTFPWWWIVTGVGAAATVAAVVIVVVKRRKK